MLLGPECTSVFTDHPRAQRDSKESQILRLLLGQKEKADLREVFESLQRNIYISQ